eukprot:1497340-Rhodomonas_salina.2
MRLVSVMSQRPRPGIKAEQPHAALCTVTPCFCGASCQGRQSTLTNPSTVVRQVCAVGMAFMSWRRVWWYAQVCAADRGLRTCLREQAHTPESRFQPSSSQTSRARFSKP